MGVVPRFTVGRAPPTSMKPVPVTVSETPAWLQKRSGVTVATVGSGTMPTVTVWVEEHPAGSGLPTVTAYAPGRTASWDRATPVALVRVSAGHSNTKSCGTTSDGAVVSRTVMVWVHSLKLPATSVALQVRLIV